MKKIFTNLLAVVCFLLIGADAAWAEDYSNAATKSFANLTFLDVENTQANGQIENGASTLVLGAYYAWMTNKQAWITRTGGNNADTNAYSYANAVKEGFIVPSSTASDNGYGGLKTTNGRITTFYVTGTTAVAIMAKDNTAARPMSFTVSEVASDGTLTTVETVTSSGKNTVYTLSGKSTLNASKYYAVAVQGYDSNNSIFYQIRFSKSDGKAATAAPSISYESTATTATVTITNKETTAAGDVYYTTDGTTPSASSTKYTSAFDLTSSCTVKAIFVPTDATAYKNSSVVSKAIVILEVQSYTATTNYAVPSTAPTAGSIIVSKNLEVKTVYGTTLFDVDNNYKTVQGRTYANAMQIRIDKIEASGVYTEKSGSTPLVITPAKNGTLQVIYRRQSDDGKTNTFTTGSGKDIHLSKSGTNAKLTGDAMAVFDTFDSNTDPSKDPAWYGHFVKQWLVEAGQEYLLWASGTTIQMAGLRFFPDHTVSTFSPGEEGYSTMCLDYDAIIPEGVEAYKGTLNSNGESLSLALSQIEEVIPANTPVVLKGNSAVTFKKNLEVKDPITGNSLQGCISSKEKSTVTGGTVCVLGYENGNAGFFKFTEETLAANKAYLVVPYSASAKINIIKGDDNVTGISNIKTQAKKGVMYNIAGQRVNANAKGLVIVNGKVVNMK